MKILILAAILVGANAHLCLLYPHQRGTANDLMTAGANDCLLVKDPPCGGRDAGSMTDMKAGSNVTIIFQKNLDHFNSKNPGKLVVTLWYSDGSKKELASMADTDAGPTKQMWYTPMIPVPDKEDAKAILQVVYITNNSEAPAEFYQCGDVNIMK